MIAQRKRFMPQQVVEPYGIKMASGRTQFIPLEHYHKPEKWLPLCYLGAIHLLAGYGLFQLSVKLMEYL